MTPQTPPTDRPLTAGDVPLLREGDVLRVVEAGSFLLGRGLVDGGEAIVRSVDPPYVDVYGPKERSHNRPSRFTFVSRPATSAASEGEGWASLETAPMDGRPFYVRAQSPFRFHPYKPASQETKRGKVGRWQTMNEYGGWENCSPPVGDWKLHPDHAAALASPPVSEREAFDAWMDRLNTDVIQDEYGYEEGEFSANPDDWRQMYDKGLSPSDAFRRALSAHREPVSERERELEGALREAKDAVDFFDRVKAATQDEQIAVGRDHWNRMEAALRAIAALTAQPAGEGK